MSLTRQQKEESIAKMESDISSATSVVFMAYDALNVSQVEELRDRLHASNSKMRVIPKRLLRLIMENTKHDFDPTQEEGQIAVIWGDDTVAPAKALHTFAKDLENVRLVAGTLEGALISHEEVMVLAQLPNKEELLGKLVGTISGPIAGLQSVLNGVQRQTTQVLSAIANQKSNA